MRDDSKPDWAAHVRPRLARLRLSATREMEIVEELLQHLDERWCELMSGGASSEEATRLALAEFTGTDVLSTHMTTLRQAHSAPATVAVLATYLPAHRASRIDPIIALRSGT